MTVATLTAGAIAGYVVIVLVVLGSVGSIARGLLDRVWAWVAGSVAVLVIAVAGWWVGMAFTTSGDYHAWNVKEGTVERVAKRLIATDSGMAERYVVTMDGQPYGIDDTRSALLKSGDRVSLRCKKDFQWGVPRAAHGWACRWNGVADAS